MLTFHAFHSSLPAAALAAALAASAVSGCATSHVMIGQARPAVSPDQVRLYLRPPERRYEEIAKLDTSSRGSFAFSAQGKTDAVVERLKAEAARLGANAVLLQGVADRAAGIAIYVEPIKVAAR